MAFHREDSFSKASKSKIYVFWRRFLRFLNFVLCIIQYVNRVVAQRCSSWLFVFVQAKQHIQLLLTRLNLASYDISDLSGRPISQCNLITGNVIKHSLKRKLTLV
jgi:hypothetical protein